MQSTHTPPTPTHPPHTRRTHAHASRCQTGLFTRNALRAPLRACPGVCHRPSHAMQVAGHMRAHVHVHVVRSRTFNPIQRAQRATDLAG